MWRIVLILAFIGLAPCLAHAVDDEACWSNCNGTCLAPQPTAVALSLKRIGGGSFTSICWEFENSSGDSGRFTVEDRTQICFDPAKGQAGAAGAAELIVRKSVGVAASTNANQWVAALPGSCTVFNGTEGAAASQCTCETYPRGTYYLNVTAAALNTENAIVTLQALAP